MAQPLQTRDELDALLSEADGLLSDDDFDSTLAEADALLAAPGPPSASSQGLPRRPPPAVPAAPVAVTPAHRAARSRPAPAPRAAQDLTVERGGRPTLPGGASGTDLEVIASSPATRSRQQPDPWRRPTAPAPPGGSPSLLERLVDLPARLPGLAPQAAKGVAAGLVGTTANTAAMLTSGAYAKDAAEAQRLSAPATFAREHFAPDASIGGDVLDDPGLMLDPQFWAYMGGQLTGSVAALAGTGGGGRAVGQAAASKLAARAPALALKLAKYGGEAASTAGEALVESADVYQTTLSQGKDPHAAADAAARAFSANAVLLGLTNHPLFDAGGRGFRQVVKRSLTEATQEAGQTVIGNVSTGQAPLEGIGTAALLGGVGGPVAGALLDGPGPREAAPNAPPAPTSPAGGPNLAQSQSVTTDTVDLRTRLEEMVGQSRAAREASRFAGSPAAAGAPNADLDVVLAEADQILGAEDINIGAPPVENAAPPAPSPQPTVERQPDAPSMTGQAATRPPQWRSRVVDFERGGAQTDPDVATAEPGDAEGAGPGGRLAGRRVPDRLPTGADRRRGEARSAPDGDPDQHYAELDQAVADAARDVDPQADPADILDEFRFRLDIYREQQQATRDAGRDPLELLRRVADLGGIAERDNGMGLHGELERLRDGQKTGAGAWGRFAGVPGVFRARTLDDRGAPATGLPLDVMVQRLQQDPRFAWLETPDDLIEALDDVLVHGADASDVLPGTDTLARAIGVDLTRDWWNDRWRPPVDVAAPSDTVAPEDGDITFDVGELEDVIAEADAVLGEDTLDTGEVQTRLPGDVGQVRDEERAQPREELPEQTFSLTAEAAPAQQYGLRPVDDDLDAAKNEADEVLGVRARRRAYPLAPRSEWYGEGTYEASGGRMVQMSPEAFLAQVRPLTIDEESRENVDILKAHIEAGKTLDPLLIRANGKEDGRHRAHAARELGLASVPVIDYRPADTRRARRRAAAPTSTASDGSQPAARAASPGATVAQGADDDVAPMTAWHGSPHVFEKFTTHKIGTGEGAQAYGWGLYFAGDKAVAEYYRKALSGPASIAVRGQPLPDFKGFRDRETADDWFAAQVRNIAADIEQGSRFDLARAESVRDLKARLDGRMRGREGGKFTRELAEAIERIEALQDGDITQQLGGRTYKVDIPEHGDYLDWDKPLHEQSETVRAALRTLGYRDNYNPQRGQDIYRRLWDDADAPVNRGRQAELTSKRLAAAGIAGIRYLDGSSRGRGEGSYNYVVFDDALVRVDEIQAMPAGGTVAPVRAAKPPRQISTPRSQSGPQHPLPGKVSLANTPKNVRPSDLVRDMSKLFDVPVGVGRLGGPYWGWYHRKLHAVRSKIANDLPVLMHEFGHAAERHLALNLADRRWVAEILQLGAATSLPSYTPKQVRAEGLAEFVRQWVLDPMTVQQRAPQFYAAFEHRLTGMGALGTGLRDLQKRAGHYVAADPEARVAMRIDFDGTGTEDLDRWFERAQVRWTDDLYWIDRATKAMAGGHPIPPVMNAYVLARNARGSIDRASDFLENGVRDWSGQFMGPSLRQALRPVAKDLARFTTYLVAKRAIELQTRRMETGITAAEAHLVVRDIEQGADAARFTKARDGVYAFQTAMLNYARETGLLSAAQQVAIQKLNQAYVPFQRVLDHGAGGVGTGRKLADRVSPIKRIKGSGRDIINPLESIIGNAYALVDAAEKNRAMQALAAQAELADERKGTGTGAGRWLRAITDPQQVTGAKLGDVLLEASKRAGATWMNQQGQPTIAPELEQVLADLNIDPEMVIPIFQSAFKGPRGEQIITVLSDGKRRFYQVEHEGLYEALTQIAHKTPDTVKLFSLATQVLRAGATLTTGFIARNPARDTLSAFLQSRHGFIPVYDTVRGGAKALLHQLGVRTDEEVALFFSQGITQATLVGTDRATLRKKIGQVADPKRHVASVILNPLSLLQAISAYTEVATRVGEFSLALRQGGERRSVWQRVLDRQRQPVTDESLAVASLAARDVTTDFARAGTRAREFNRYAAFFNARVQGYVRIAETLRTQPQTVAFNIGALMLAAVILKALNEDDEDYAELAEWEKLAYWHWRPTWEDGQADTFVRIPKPFEWAFAPNLAEAAVDWARGRDAEPWKLVKAQIHDNARQIAFGLLPSLLLPTVEAGANYSFFRQRNIVNPWDLDLPLEQQAGEWTTETAKLLTRLGLPVAPAKVDHWLFGHTAGLGRSAVQGLFDPALRAVGVAPPSRVLPAKRWEDTPFVGAYVRSAAPRSDAESLVEFYTAFREMSGATRGVNRAKADPEQQQRILDSVKTQRWRGREAEMRAAKKKLDDIGDEVDRIYADQTMTPDFKGKSLDGLRRAAVYEARVALGYESTAHLRRSSRR